MTMNIGASIFINRFFYLEYLRTGLSLIVFGFKKLPLVVMIEHYKVWVILGHVYGLFAGFHTIDSVLDDT